MRKIMTLALGVTLLAACAPGEVTLKDALEGKFLIGCALNEAQIRQLDAKGDSVFLKHFNAAEPENCLKSCEIMPAWGTYNWELADAYVDFCERHGITCIGHCLTWHSQCTPDYCYDSEGRLLSADSLKIRMKEYISTVVGRYKGRIKGWDVVNEAILEDGSYRRSPFWQILGGEFIPWSFECAHEADPDCELYINDYAMHESAKLDKYIEIVNDMLSRGLRVDAVGFQGHIGMDYPGLSVYERHLRRVKEETGLDVCITELDMSIQPTLTRSADLGDMSFTDAMKVPEIRDKWMAKMNPWPDGVPAERVEAWNERFASFWEMFLRNSDIIRRVNVWGVCDLDSWKNGWPVPERQDSPLFVGRDYALKPFLQDFIARKGAPRPLAVALSFDDGPNNTITPQVLDLLEQYGIPASFFVIGRNVGDETADVMKRAVSLGCDIENHSFNHPYMSRLTESEMISEISATDSLIVKYVGAEPRFFRPPYIDTNALLHSTVDKTFICGYSCHDWDPAVSAEARVDLVMDHIRDGLIILLHDGSGNQPTVEALKTIIPTLLDRGCRFMTVPGLFEAKGLTPEPHDGIVYSTVINK